MDKIMECAVELNKRIAQSETYKAYISSKAVLENDTDNYDKYKAFYEVHLKYQLNIARGGTATFDEEKYVSGLYSEVMLIENIRNYIDSRNKLIHLLNEINHRVFKNILL